MFLDLLMIKTERMDARQARRDGMVAEGFQDAPVMLTQREHDVSGGRAKEIRTDTRIEECVGVLGDAVHDQRAHKPFGAGTPDEITHIGGVGFRVDQHVVLPELTIEYANLVRVLECLGTDDVPVLTETGGQAQEVMP